MFIYIILFFYSMNKAIGLALLLGCQEPYYETEPSIYVPIGAGDGLYLRTEQGVDTTEGTVETWGRVRIERKERNLHPNGTPRIACTFDDGILAYYEQRHASGSLLTQKEGDTFMMDINGHRQPGASWSSRVSECDHYRNQF